MGCIARRRLPLAGTLVSCSILVAACGATAPSAPPTATPAPTATAPASTTPATPGPTTPGPTSVPTPSVSLPPFACGTAVRQAGSVPIARITALEAVNDGGVGRITFTFEPAGNLAAVPEVEVRPATPPFTRDPSGLPLDVQGSGFVSLVLFGGTALDEDFNPTFEGPFDIDPAGGSPIVAFRRSGDFEAVSSFVAGLDGAPCVRILPPDGTSRLVVELESER